MKKVFLTITSIAVLAAIIGSAFAANPADLTATQRSFVKEFIKITYDGGPRWACINVPTGNTVNATVFNWQNKEADSRFTQLLVVKRFSSWLDGAIEATFADEAPTHNLIADVHWKFIGLGVKLPLENGGVVSLGPRTQVKGLTAYLTVPLSQNSDGLYGISYKAVKDITIETAYGKKAWFVRVSRGFETRFGTFIPESRNKFTKDEKFLGAAIGFIPK